MFTNGDESASVSEPCARYKYQRLRERLRQAIETGELSGKLPGERALARSYGANAKTINKALSDLTTEGLLVRHVGRGTFVADGQTGHADALRRPLAFGWLGPGLTDHADRQACYLQADEIFRSRGHRLEKLSVNVDFSREIPEGTLSPSRLRKLDGVILFSCRPSAAFLADLHRRHLPLVIANNCHDEIKTPAVVPDYAQGAFELSQHLVRLGHREIQLLISDALLPAAGEAESGYRAAVQRHGWVPREVWRIGKRFEWDRALRGDGRPTALVCVGALLAVDASRKARDAGLKAPSMMSVVALPGPGEMLPAEDAITAYEVPVDRIVHWATELLLSASPGQLPRTVIVPGHFHDRGSAAPPDSGAEPILASPGEAMI